MSKPLSSDRKAALLAIYSVLVALRYPWLLLHGRLWAEEGTVYLRSAWSGTVASSLFASHLGYLAIWTNMSALLAARVFPLPYAAVIMTWCAFLIQILAGYLLVQCELLKTNASRAIALAILLVGVGMESWLNTINSQFYLAICSGIILISSADRLKILRNSVLVLAAFTGPVTCFLAPFFLLRAFLARTKANLLQAGIITSCACIQALVVVRALHTGVRQVNFQAAGVAPIFLVNFILDPLSGRIGRLVGYSAILNNSASPLLPVNRIHHFPLTWPFLLLWAVLDIAFIAWLFYITADTSDRSSWWLLAMSLWLAAFAMYGAVGGTYDLDERYVLPSTFLIGTSLLLTAVKRRLPSARRVSASCLVVMFLAAGTVDYFYYPYWAAKQRSGEPTWTGQAELWQHDPATRLPVWPKGWMPQGFSLPPDHK
jgi:hypothetical protein